MRRRLEQLHPPLLVLSAAGTALAIAVVAVLLLTNGSSAREATGAQATGAQATGAQAASGRPAIAISVSQTAYGRPIAPGFVGLSLEFPAIEAYAGSDPHAVNPVFAQLIRNLAPGQQPSLRIGGDSSDWTWWPVPGMTRPPGVRFVLDPRWRAVAAALAQELQARFILGINLEADSLPAASTEARQLSAALAPSEIQGLEPGNEPELYGSFAWYRTAAGKAVPGRPRSYSYGGFLNDFRRFAGVLHEGQLAGPATGAITWIHMLPAFLAIAPRLGVVTLHRYPLQLCFVKPTESKYPTIGNLLSEASSRGLADSVIPSVALVHQRGLPLRIDEMNTISCGSDPIVGETYASALWGLDSLFEMARVGVDGVNIHTYPGATYELFTFSGRTAFVFPEYYGLMMFAQAAPAGARLLHVGGATASGLKTWATRAPDGHTRVVLINKSTTVRVVAVHVPGGATATAPAALERLTAPSLTARTGTTLGGHGFGTSTSTGQLPAPDSLTVTPVGGSYEVRLPPASATMLTF